MTACSLNCPMAGLNPHMTADSARQNAHPESHQHQLVAYSLNSSSAALLRSGDQFTCSSPRVSARIRRFHFHLDFIFIQLSFMEVFDAALELQKMQHPPARQVFLIFIQIFLVLASTGEKMYHIRLRGLEAPRLLHFTLIRSAMLLSRR